MKSCSRNSIDARCHNEPQANDWQNLPYEFTARGAEHGGMGQHDKAYENGILQNAVKNMRRQQAGENAAQHTAKGHPQIELGKVFGWRAQVIKPLVAHQGRGKEEPEVYRATSERC